ncbi:MAG: helix-turn-helix transcriptional regulator [Flavobacteriaceae bacterium]|nr:helix-turn-helix transcriptional regulator [Flavobacteriaceae bacterium]
MMKISIDYDLKFLLDKVLDPLFKKYGLEYEFNSLAEIGIKGSPSPQVMNDLQEDLSVLGITIINDHKHGLVQKIKKAITTYLIDGESVKDVKLSTYLADTCNYSYAHLSSTFSEVTYSSIENFVILKKIEVAKKHLNTGNYTLTEIAHKLGYSSVAHLSNQFKNTTGLSPTLYREIIRQKKESDQLKKREYTQIDNEN